MVRLLASLFLFLCLFNTSVVRAEVQYLDSKVVIKKVLENGYSRRLVDQNYQMSETFQYSARAALGTEFNMNYGYEMTRLKNLSGFNNPEDRNTTMGAGLSKKVSTGTTFGVQYARTIQNSVLNAFTSGLRSPNQTQDITVFNVRQKLLNNFFGYQDRIKIEVANLSRSKSQIERDENLEKVVLDANRAYWDAYAAKENLKDSMMERDKFSILVDYLKVKKKLGITDFAKLSRAVAEFNDQDRAVKAASLHYINSLNSLYLLMNEPVPNEVEFENAANLPLPPSTEKGQPADLNSFRKIKAQSLAVLAAEQEEKAAINAALPSLDLVGKLAANGIQKTSERSFPEMVNGRHPNYFLGLEFIYAFDSDLVRADKIAKNVQYQSSLIQLDKLKADVSEAVNRTGRNISAKYMVAKTATETVDTWEKVIQDQESNLKLGRITTFELIQDYGAYFRARMVRNLAVADYHISLQEYLEARDELIQESPAAQQ